MTASHPSWVRGLHVVVRAGPDQPAEQGGPASARTTWGMAIGWTPTVDFAGLVGMMVSGDLKLAEAERQGRLPAS